MKNVCKCRAGDVTLRNAYTNPTLQQWRNLYLLPGSDELGAMDWKLKNDLSSSNAVAVAGGIRRAFLQVPDFIGTDN